MYFNLCRQIVAAFLALSYFACTAPAATDRAAVLNKPAPKWDLVDLNGAPHSLSDYLGKVVVLDFWFRGCGWCIKAMPQVKQLAADFANRSVAILGMNTDTDPADAKFVVQELGLNYPVLRAPAEPADYHVRVFPTLIIVDRHGVIRERKVGYDPKLHDDVSAIIERLLAEK
jgi:thiol-disulfide isomerase/thioredoxin